MTKRISQRGSRQSWNKSLSIAGLLVHLGWLWISPAPAGAETAKLPVGFYISEGAGAYFAIVPLEQDRPTYSGLLSIPEGDCTGLFTSLVGFLPTGDARVIEFVASSQATGSTCDLFATFSSDFSEVTIKKGSVCLPSPSFGTL